MKLQPSRIVSLCFLQLLWSYFLVKKYYSLVQFVRRESGFLDSKTGPDNLFVLILVLHTMDDDSGSKRTERQFGRRGKGFKASHTVVMKPIICIIKVLHKAYCNV